MLEVYSSLPDNPTLMLDAASRGLDALACTSSVRDASRGPRGRRFKRPYKMLSLLQFSRIHIAAIEREQKQHYATAMHTARVLQLSV